MTGWHDLQGSAPRHLRAVALAVVAWLAVGCGGDAPSDAAPGPERPSARAPSPAPRPLAPAVRTLLDEGNDAFEAGNYSGALRSYEAAVEADSTAAPAWFGLYMTYDALGETEKARELRARLTEMSPPGPGDPHAVPAEDGPPSLEGSAAREEGA